MRADPWPEHPRIAVGDSRDPEGLQPHLRRYLAYLEERNYSSYTVYGWGLSARHFIAWCEERGVRRVEELDRALLEGYQRHLFHHRKRNGDPLTVGTQHTLLVAIQHWMKWMVKRGHLPFSPAADLELPRRGMCLPKAILTEKEAEAVLAVPDLHTPLGLRDRAILETFYSTGMRRMELMNLRSQEVDTARGVVMIRQGKGKKDRVVPIGERALLWIGAYRERVRPELVGLEDDGTLFLSVTGRALTPMALSRMAREYVNQSGIGKKGSCHLFRHTMATLMLEHGADTRHVQAILGHARLDSTQVYTHVSIGHLKAIHTATHPGKVPEAFRRLREGEGGSEAILEALAGEAEDA